MEIYGKKTRNSTATLTDQGTQDPYYTASLHSNGKALDQVYNCLLLSCLVPYPPSQLFHKRHNFFFIYQNCSSKQEIYNLYTYGINMLGRYCSQFILQISRGTSQGSSNFHINVVVVDTNNDTFLVTYISNTLHGSATMLSSIMSRSPTWENVDPGG